MFPQVDLKEYEAEIRRVVCSRCIERPPGGPPCAPLGKVCGIEEHMREIVDAIHEVRSDLLAPYLENNRIKVCLGCPHYQSEICPCPMDYLVELLVEAVEAVDARHAQTV